MENECRSTRKNRQRFGILSSVIAVIKPPRSRRRRRFEHAGRGVNTWQCSDRGVRNNGLLEALRRVLTAGELVARSVVRGGRRSWRLVGVGGRCRMRQESARRQRGRPGKSLQSVEWKVLPGLLRDPGNFVQVRLDVIVPGFACFSGEFTQGRADVTLWLQV